MNTTRIIDPRTDTLMRLFAKKVFEAKVSPNKIVDKTRPPMENAVNGY